MNGDRKKRHFGLLFVGSRTASGGERFFSVLEEALAGGAGAFLLREKDLGGGELLEMAKRARGLTRAHGALLLISDRIDVALAADADGVHLPEDSFTPEEARRLVGAERLVGRSVHDREGALAAERSGADLLVLGPVFETPGKERFRMGVERASSIAQDVRIPVTAIGGIDEGNVDEVVAAGFRSVAVIRAIAAADDPRRAAGLLSGAVGQAE